MLRRIVALGFLIAAIGCGGSSGGDGYECPPTQTICGQYHMFSYDPKNEYYGVYDVSFAEVATIRAVPPIPIDLKEKELILSYKLDESSQTITIDGKEVGSFNSEGDLALLNTAFPDNDVGMSVLFKKGVDMSASDLEGKFYCGGVTNTGVIFTDVDIPHTGEFVVNNQVGPNSDQQRINITGFQVIKLHDIKVTAPDIVDVSPDGRFDVFVYGMIWDAKFISLDGFVHPSGNLLHMQFDNILGLSPYAVLCIKSSETPPVFSGNYVQAKVVARMTTKDLQWSTLADVNVISDKLVSTAEYAALNAEIAQPKESKYLVKEDGRLVVKPGEGVLSPDGRFYYLTYTDIINLNYEWMFGFQN